MPNNTPAEYYRHFKGNVNEFIGIAKNSEDPEKELVVYQAISEAESASSPYIINMIRPSALTKVSGKRMTTA